MWYRSKIAIDTGLEEFRIVGFKKATTQESVPLNAVSWEELVLEKLPSYEDEEHVSDPKVLNKSQNAQQKSQYFSTMVRSRI